MDLSEYKNVDGTFTSPKNGKVFKSEQALRSHLCFRRSEKAFNFRNYSPPQGKCQFCSREMRKGDIVRHETGCYLNPTNKVECKFCKKPILNFRHNKATCSRSCANSFFKTGENNGNWKQDAYQSTCFLHHNKKCVVCGEINIVAAHHLDENHQNNAPENLIPLCPTHHQYWHSKFRHLVEPTVREYIANWKKNYSD